MKSLLDRAGLEVDALNHRENSIWGYALIFGLVGLVFLFLAIASLFFIVLGLITLGFATYFYRSKRRPVELLLNQKRKDLAVIALGFEHQLGKVSEEVFQQLSDIHDAKIHPTVRHIVVDFAAIIQAARGRGIILETIQCPSCSGTVSLPKGGDTFQCAYCGKTIHAIDIFDKLKLP